MSNPPLPDWEEVLSAAARLQTILPKAVLVGGTAAAMHVGHRLSADADPTLEDLVGQFDEVLETLESIGGWETARVKRPVLNLHRKEIEILGGAVPPRSQQVQEDPTFQHQLVPKAAPGYARQKSFQDKKHLGVLDALAIDAGIAQALQDAGGALGIALLFHAISTWSWLLSVVRIRQTTSQRINSSGLPPWRRKVFRAS